MNSPMQIVKLAQQFRQDPIAVLQRRFNLPTQMNNPQEIVQHLLNSGQVTQEQVNQAVRMKDDPSLRQLFR